MNSNNFITDLVGRVIKLSSIPSGPPGTTTKFVLNILTNGMILLFTAVIIIAIVYSVLAGLKYIRSQGEADKVEEAQNALKAVFIGVITVFVGVIVVVIVSGIFSNQGADQVRAALCTFIEPTVSATECARNSI
jgi:succinate dehydrogenase/fumarate reductase cytochrome b subunit